SLVVVAPVMVSMAALCAASVSARSFGSARLLICREREWLSGESRTFTSVILPLATTMASSTVPYSLAARAPLQVPSRSPGLPAFVGVARLVGDAFGDAPAEGAAADGARDGVA